jgi:hypothetical protein
MPDTQEDKRGLPARALVAIELIAVSCAFAVVPAEAVLRLVLDSGNFLQATLIDDPDLGYRVKPSTTGHDALGFRNERVPAQAAIVAIGDSMTYGVSADRAGSWPNQLGQQLGVTVYNMGLGGYGPLQYLHLARELAPTLKPEQLIVAFYFGNDLMDAYRLAHFNPRWHAWQQSTPTPAGETPFDRAGREAPKKRFEGLRDWLSRRSLLYGVLRATVFQPLASLERNQAVEQASQDTLWPWRDPGRERVCTVFTPKQRLSATDLSVESVREGMEISKRAFAELKAVAQGQGRKLLVVLIPTKERVYCGYLTKMNADITATFTRLSGAEAVGQGRADADL